jgi:3-isopropylmalate dehydratase small subunit
VIAKSLAFIYARNQPNLGLLGIVIIDETFYEAAKDGESIEVDLGMRKVKVKGREWTFKITEMELGIIKVGGIEKAFEKFGKGLFEVLCRSGKEVKKGVEGMKGPSELAW